MKEQIIKYGIDNKVPQDKMEEVFTNNYNESFNLTKNAEHATKKAIIMLKKFIRSYIDKLNKSEDFKLISLGNSITDWGQIMKRKHGDFYPKDGKFKPGEAIPEHEYENKLVVLNTANNTIFTITTRTENLNEVECLTIEAGTVFTTTLVKGQKENTFYFNKDVSKILVEKKLNFKEYEQELLLHAKDYLVDVNQLSEALPGIKIIKAEALDPSKQYDNFNLVPMDSSTSMESKGAAFVIKIPVKNFAYTFDVENAIIVCEKTQIKNDVIEYKGYSIVANELYKVESEKMPETEENLI